MTRTDLYPLSRLRERARVRATKAKAPRSLAGPSVILEPGLTDLEVAVVGLRSVDSPGGAGRDELHRDGLRGSAGFVPDEMDVTAAFVDEALAGMVADRRAQRWFLDRDLAERDRDQVRHRMGMPTALPADVDRIAGHVDVGRCLRPDL